MRTLKVTMSALLIIFAFAVVQVYAAGGTDSAAGSGMSQDTAQMGQSQSPLKASELLGKSLKDQQGQELGQVSDIVIGQQGEVQFVVLEPSGDLQKEGELIPIPWQKIQAQADQEDLTASVDMQTLQDAPTISQDQFDQLSSQEMQSQVRGYYGVEEEGLQQQPGMGMEQENGMGGMNQQEGGGMGMEQGGQTQTDQEQDY